VSADVERDRQSAARWARSLLEQPIGQVLILDTETTGLGDAYLVELALTDTAGRPVLVSRLNPPTAVEADAVAIHGLSSPLLEGMTRFTDLAPVLADLVRGRTLVIYNAHFERRILRNELGAVREDVRDYVRTGLNAAQWECAMLRYAAFVGDFNDVHGDYRWQKLPGGDHTALGDCRATVQVLHAMSAAAEVPSDTASPDAVAEA
jgi:DNA polymerase-3 subunit epsilon